jgi:hypothetical protein
LLTEHNTHAYITQQKLKKKERDREGEKAEKGGKRRGG